MQSIKILTRDLEPITDTTDYVSCIFSNSWRGIGAFQFVIHRDAAGVSDVEKGFLIALDRNKVGMVRHMEIEVNQSGKMTENWIFKGPMLKGLAGQRVAVPLTDGYYLLNDPPETIMKELFNRNAINVIDSDRIMQNIIIAPDQRRGEPLTWRSRYNYLSEDFEEICFATGLGWSISLSEDSSTFVFDIQEGRDLTVNNTDGHSPVFFASEFGNLKTQSFVDSDLDYKNFAYVAGQDFEEGTMLPDGEHRMIVPIGEGTGYDRFEIFIDARDIENDENDPVVPTQELIDRGHQKLDELTNVLYLDAEVQSPITDGRNDEVLSETFVYGRDYNVGDFVTVMNREWGVSTDQQITEVREIHERNGFSLELTFGQDRPTFVDKLKTKFGQYDIELRK